MTELNLSGTFYVRNNLKAALLRFRHPHDDVNVWVDALCIDQENTVEKKAQVSRMHEVYTQAENVCVWLGEGKESTPETFSFLREILDLHNFDNLIADPEATARKWALIVDLMSNRWFSRRWVIQELALARKASVRWGDEELEWSNFADAIALFMTKYEEIKRTSLDPKGFHDAIDARALGANTIVHATTNLFRKSREGRVQQRLLPLEILVSSLLLAFEASEPRDTIFAVLTLANDSIFAVEHTDSILEDPRISPDYDKSLLDVYADFMNYCVEKSQSLDIMCRYWAPLPKPLTPEQALKLGSSGRDKEEKMSTWIPFISRSAFGEPHGVLGGRVNGDSFVGGPERKGQQTYNASNNLRAWAKFGTYEVEPSRDPARRSTFPTNFMRQGSFSSTSTKRPELGKIQEHDNQPHHSRSDGAMKDLARSSSFPTPPKYDGTLSVRGFCLDHVHEVSGRVMGKGIIPAEALNMGGWPHPPVDQDVPDQLWRTLVADRGPNGTSAPGWYRRTCLECLQHTDRVGDLDIEGLKKSVQPKTPSTMITFLERAQQIVWGRRFFKTRGNKTKHKEPLFCLGSPDVREGDMVCIIFGCSVPVVLRKVSAGGGGSHYEFIGECYVHGMMDGEALEGRQPMYPYGGKKSWVTTFKLK
jgi:hypothetical protein